MTECARQAEDAFDVATLSDVGTEREHNEDHCGHAIEDSGHVVVAVADGVSGAEAGEIASRTAVDVALRTYREQAASVSAKKRLYRAVQQANIEIYNRATVVTELRGMSTTLTALTIARGELAVAHVGDCRLYRLRDGTFTQLTKDHTVVATRVRMKLLTQHKARAHPDRSVLTRSLGRELIVAVDRITTRVTQHDVLLVCSDGLYNVLEDGEMAHIVCDADAASACRNLLEAANQRGTVDNLTAAVVRVTGEVPDADRAVGLGQRFKRLVGRRPK
jgi:serine/threonine protein phosphatase PrpC